MIIIFSLSSDNDLQYMCFVNNNINNDDFDDDDDR